MTILCKAVKLVGSNSVESSERDHLLATNDTADPQSISSRHESSMSLQAFNELKHLNGKTCAHHDQPNRRYHERAADNYLMDDHRYGDISFVDSSSAIETYGSNQKLLRSDASLKEPPNKSKARMGKFRFFISFYLLLGVTLLSYSRNTLSLVAVKMVANNAINGGLSFISSLNVSDQPYANIINLRDLNGTSHAREVPSEVLITTANLLSQGLGFSYTTRSNFESQFNISIKEGIESGQLVDWSPSEQGIVFAAGSIGNILFTIPLTRLGEKHGAKWWIFVAAASASIHGILMPYVASYHVALVILFQIIFNGLPFGVDCIAYSLFACWLPPTELSFFAGCLLVCHHLGAIMSSMITAGILVSNLSWIWCFYSSAILCGAWTLIWMVIGASRPSDSRWISRDELVFILKNSKMPQVDNENLSDKDRSTEHSSVSWLKLAKDPNIWAVTAVKFSLTWYFSTYAGLMPTYLSSMVHMSIETIGKIGIFQSIICLTAGVLTNYLTRSFVTTRPFNLSIGTIRKILQSIVNFGLSLTLVIFMIFPNNHWIVILSLTAGGVFINFCAAAAWQLPLDLSPKHCGLIVSISNTIAIGQTLGAPISGLVLNGGPTDRTLWNVVWSIAILLNVSSGLLFIFMVDAKPRDYSKKTEDNSAT